MTKTSETNRAETKSQLIGVHCSLSLTDAIDAFTNDQFDHMKRPEAIRILLIGALAERGYLQRNANRS